MCNFEQKVKNGLSRCCKLSEEHFTDLKIGVAVSGGADSVSLLLSLSRILPSVKVITVNHNIREVEETRGDAEFVNKLCEKLGNCSCKVIEIPRGKVFDCANERGLGVEEAARFLRYSIFEEFIKDNNLDFLCLAHNQNDQLETVLMRFLSGASSEALSGIKFVRGKYIRPLLEIKREEIEEYLNENGQDWRTDSTNSNVAYQRNKIRHELMPYLSAHFPQWQAAVLSGANRAAGDAAVIEAAVAAAEESFGAGERAVAGEFPLHKFKTFPPAIQHRLLLKACNNAGETQRIPHVFLEDFCKNPREISFHNVEFSVKNNTIFVKKRSKTRTQTLFSAIIYIEGFYSFPFGSLSVEGNGQTVNLIFNDEFILKGVTLPVAVRSAYCDDEVENADGTKKKITDIYSDWHVPEQKRELIPVVQQLAGKNQDIICIFGNVCGFNNWIVKRLLK